MREPYGSVTLAGRCKLFSRQEKTPNAAIEFS